MRDFGYIGKVTGDLSGTVFSPTVIKIKNIEISNISPSHGQALLYSSGTNKYVPQTISGSGGGISYDQFLNSYDDVQFNSVTGNLLGTSSYAIIAESASYVIGAGSSSYSNTASYALLAATASYITASNINNFSNDVRRQFRAGTNITINDGVISASIWSTAIRKLEVYETAYIASLTVGQTNSASYSSLAVGDSSIAYSEYSHAEGYNTMTSGAYSHAEGYGSKTYGTSSHAEGSATQAHGDSSHAEGISTRSYGNYSHSEGQGADAVGLGSHAEGVNTAASGNYSHTEGWDSKTYGSYSHAEGRGCTTYGIYSHAEGWDCSAVGQASHAEGYRTLSSGSYTHTAGSQTTASRTGAHSEGLRSIASGLYSHAEGQDTLASGNNSHTQGTYTTASGYSDHAEGYGTIARGGESHAEGFRTIANREASHAEGSYTTAFGMFSHAEGTGSYAYGAGSHAEGSGTYTFGNYSHAEGSRTKADDNYAHAEGYYAQAGGIASHAEGSNTWAYSDFSHAEGFSTLAVGESSHAEGIGTLTESSASHAEGYQTTASGDYSHAAGERTQALGKAAVAMGYSTNAIGNYSHAEGSSTIASGSNQLVIGLANLQNNTSSLFVIGNGINSGSRSDIFRVNRSNVEIIGNLQVSGAVTASYFVGNGSLLTNLPTGSGDSTGDWNIQKDIIFNTGSNSSNIVSGNSSETYGNIVSGYGNNIINSGTMYGNIILAYDENIQVSGDTYGNIILQENNIFEAESFEGNIFNAYDSNFSGSGWYSNFFGGYGHKLTGSIFASHIFGRSTKINADDLENSAVFGNQNIITGSQTITDNAIYGSHNYIEGGMSGTCQNAIFGDHNNITYNKVKLFGDYLTSSADSQIIFGIANDTGSTSQFIIANGTAPTFDENGDMLTDVIRNNVFEISGSSVKVLGDLETDNILLNKGLSNFNNLSGSQNFKRNIVFPDNNISSFVDNTGIISDNIFSLNNCGRINSKSSISQNIIFALDSSDYNFEGSFNFIRDAYGCRLSGSIYSTEVVGYQNYIDANSGSIYNCFILGDYNTISTDIHGIGFESAFIVGDNNLSTHGQTNLLGDNLTTTNDYQTIIGQYNNTGSAPYIFAVANGIDGDNRKNILEISGSSVKLPQLTGVTLGTDLNGVIGDANSSDIRLKKYVKTLDNSLEKVKQLRPVSFLWKDKERYGSDREIGLIAQEVELVVPEVVGINSEGYKNVDYPKLVAHLIGAVKELSDQNKQLLARIEVLESK